ncbi:MAG: sigma-70 family RNA polymerase sigma factor [Thermoanaerobaculia bacterium]
MDRTSDTGLAGVIQGETGRLRRFLQARVADRRDVEDILQDVFYELVLADRMTRPIGNVGAWLFEVARNRVADLFRRKRPSTVEGDEGGTLADMLPSPDAGPEAAYARSVLLDELAEALDELPAEQRIVFLAHEAEGRSFQELAAETGVPINTLLSRKRYAVFFLRRRLAAIYAEYKKG